MQPLPQRIGKYEVRGKLGEGRMGVVYLAYDTVLEREVALKVMATSIESNEELRERFLQEAKAIARLANHPNIVSVNDLGYDEQGAPTSRWSASTGAIWTGDSVMTHRHSPRSWRSSSRS